MRPDLLVPNTRHAATLVYRVASTKLTTLYRSLSIVSFPFGFGIGLPNRVRDCTRGSALDGRAPADSTPTETEGTIPARPQAVLRVLRNPIRNEGCKQGNGGTRMA